MKSKHQRGFYLIEAIVVMSIVISLMGMGVRYITRDADRTVHQITAKQLQQVTQAAEHYVRDHYQAFQDNESTSLSIEDLIEQGYLSDTVYDKQSYKNHYGQTYSVRVEKNQGRENTLLQVIITTEGGHLINESSMRQIAALAGSSTGYVSILNEGKITGNQQSWFVESKHIPIEVGHLASLKIVSDKEVMDADTFLRRKKIDNHPEYNRMETNLDIDIHKLIANDLNLNSTMELNNKNLSFQLNTDKKISITTCGDINKRPEIKIINNNGKELTLESGFISLDETIYNKKDSVTINRPSVHIGAKTAIWF